MAGTVRVFHQDKGSGNHKEIAKWRKEKSLEQTIKNRPDLINK